MESISSIIFAISITPIVKIIVVMIDEQVVESAIVYSRILLASNKRYAPLKKFDSQLMKNIRNVFRFRGDL